MQLTTIAAARPGLPLNPGIRQLGPGLNVVLGPNGCGKSTLQQLVRDLLDSTVGDRTESNGLIAGSIGITAGAGRLRIVRCVRPGHPETTAVVTDGNEGARLTTGPDRSRLPSLVRFAEADNLHRVDDLARLAAAFSHPATDVASDPSESGPFAPGNWEVVTRSLQQQIETAHLRSAATLRAQVRRQRALHTRRRWLDAEIARQLDAVHSLDQDWQAAHCDMREADEELGGRATPVAPTARRATAATQANLAELSRREAALQEVLDDLAQQRMRHTRLMATGLHSAACPTLEVRDRLDRCEIEVLHQLHVVQRQQAQLQSPAADACPHCGPACPTCGGDITTHVESPANGTELPRSVDSASQLRRDGLRSRANDLQARLLAARDTLNDLYRRRVRLDAIRRAAACDAALDLHRYVAAELEQLLSDALRRGSLTSRRAPMHEESTHAAIDVFALASASFQRLTQGRYLDLTWNPRDNTLLAQGVEGPASRLCTLSRGANEQAALALRLALLRAFAADGRAEPAVWDEPLADTDELRLQAAAAELAAVANGRLQLIILTCREHVAGVLEQHGAIVHRLGEAAPITPAEPQVHQPPRQIMPEAFVEVANDEPAIEDHAVIEAPPAIEHHVEPAQAAPEPVAAAPMIRVHPAEPYWLRPESPLTQVPSLGFQFARRLRALGLNEVRDLVQFDPGLKLELLRELQITVGQVQVWQAEARLLCGVPDLTARDAQLLASCGLLRAEDLAQADVDELAHRLDRLRGGRNDWHPALAASPRRESIARWINAARRRLAEDIERQVRVESPGSRGDESPAVERAALEPSAPLQFVGPGTADDGTSPRFRLHLDSPVVDAPSIGLKTAKLLGRAGIVTVADLLECDPVRTAARLRHRRISADVIRTWQRQSVLMCTVPELRCADAALLVACGIASPLDLRRISPSALSTMLQPLLSSIEGQRLLRGAHAPTVDDITRWTETVEETRVRRAA